MTENNLAFQLESKYRKGVHQALAMLEQFLRAHRHLPARATIMALRIIARRERSQTPVDGQQPGDFLIDRIFEIFERKTDLPPWREQSLKPRKWDDELPRKIGPVKPDEAIAGQVCQACNDPIVVGDYCALVPLGPGRSDEARARARHGRVYNAVALPVHYVCATGHVAAATEREGA